MTATTYLAWLLVLLWSLYTAAGVSAKQQQAMLQDQRHPNHTALIIVDMQNCFTPPDGELAVPGGREIVPVINQLRQHVAFAAVVVTQDWHPPNHISFYTQHENGQAYQHKQLLYAPDGRLLTCPKQLRGCDDQHGTCAARRSGNSSSCTNRTTSSGDTCTASRMIVHDDGPGECEAIVVDQVLWPPHCIMDTRSAEPVEQLVMEPGDVRVRKGSNPFIDNYSAFWDAGHFEPVCVTNPQCVKGQRSSLAGAQDGCCTTLHEELRCRGINDVVIVGLAADFCVKFTAMDAADMGYRTWLVVDGTQPAQEGVLPDVLSELQGHGVRLVNSTYVLSVALQQDSISCFTKLVH